MARIRCHYLDCSYLESGFCGAPQIELDPEDGCLTYAPMDDVGDTTGWDEPELEELWEEEGLYEEDDLEEEEDWFEEDEEF